MLWYTSGYRSACCIICLEWPSTALIIRTNLLTRRSCPDFDQVVPDHWRSAWVLEYIPQLKFRRNCIAPYYLQFVSGMCTLLYLCSSAPSNHESIENHQPTRRRSPSSFHLATCLDFGLQFKQIVGSLWMSLRYICIEDAIFTWPQYFLIRWTFSFLSFACLRMTNCVLSRFRRGYFAPNSNSTENGNRVLLSFHSEGLQPFILRPCPRIYFLKVTFQKWFWRIMEVDL